MSLKSDDRTLYQSVAAYVADTILNAILIEFHCISSLCYRPTFHRTSVHRQERNTDRTISTGAANSQCISDNSCVVQDKPWLARRISGAEEERFCYVFFYPFSNRTRGSSGHFVCVSTLFVAVFNSSLLRIVLFATFCRVDDYSTRHI